MRVSIFVFLTGLIVGCAPTDNHNGQQTNDVATDVNADSGTWIYFAEGSDIVRAECADGAVLFDRATCKTDPVTVPAGLFFQEVNKYFGAELPRLETEKSAAFIKIQRIDVRLIDILSIEPDPIRSDLKPAIDAKLWELAEIAAVIAAFAEQIARIERELLLGEDPSLRLLLHDTQLKISEAKTTESELQKQLLDLRQLYIAANATIFDQTMFRDLQAQRAQIVSSLRTIDANMGTEMDELVQMNRTFKMVIDQGFVYELRAHAAGFPESKVVAGKFFAAFNAADLSYRTMAQTLTPNQRGLVFSVGRDATLETFECRFVFNAMAGCDGITIKGGNQDLYVTGESFQITSNYVSQRNLSIMRSINVKGAWIVAPVCRFITPGGAPAPWTQFNCKFVVDRN